ncbi:hypothetical protein AB0I81_10610 [Nonomuraea sp. NPDC050404]|uniref:hypothetical protein n=1 Tax=Nonomuraea sp. NPDC050404 TaxID=3155783 RepID=UPI0033D2781D
MSESPGLNGQPPLAEGVRVTLVPLTVVAERGEYILGDPAVGRFFAVPEIALRVIDGLRAGMTVGQSGEHASTEDARVDGLDVARLLLRAGFVAEIDGRPVPRADGTTPPRPLHPVMARAGRMVFSLPAMVGYALLLLLVLVTFVLRPGLRPGFESLFIDPRPALSFAVLFGLAVGTGMLHELCHWWAARSLGVPARIRFGRRLYIPVFETDVSGLWSLPARLRYGTFLAGMAFDVLLLAAAVGTRLAWSLGVLDVPPWVLRVMGVLVAMKVFDLMFQGLVFLRTDLYAVMITALGGRNLAKVSRLRLKRFLRLAKAAERAELAAAHPRDLEISRWYTVVYLAGLIWAVWFFKTWFYPSSYVVMSWMGETLVRASPTGAHWWQAAVVGTLVSTNIAWPIAVFARERIVLRRERHA